MKKLLIVLLILLTVSGVGFCVATKAEYAKSEHGIGVTYHRAQLEDKPMFILFYVNWCAGCQNLLPKVKLLNAIYQNAYNFVLINCEDTNYKDLVDDFYISSYPTVYIVDDRIKNRIHLDNGYYGDVNLMKRELDRYLTVRKLIKQ